MTPDMDVRLEKDHWWHGEKAEEAAGDRATLRVKYDEPGVGTADADGPGDGSDRRSPSNRPWYVSVCVRARARVCLSAHANVVEQVHQRVPQ